MGLGTSAEKMGARFSEAGSQIADSFKGLFGKSETVVVQAAERGVLGRGWDASKSGVKGAVKFSVKTPIKAAFAVAALPFQAIMRVAGSVAGATGNFYQRMPKTAWGITAIGAVAGIGSIVAHRAEKNTQNDFNRQIAKLQDMQMQQPVVQGPVANNYVLPPGEYTRTVEPRLRQAGQAGSQVEALAARSAQPAATAEL